ncbi:MAG: hypothetical protein IIY52_03415 [Solobacterium sp.]|nr:hypothetical protein [Erysipelotrichaceae bacterium]MBQ1325046.1 hypothetical protein [Solobacterium sp.]
MMIEDLTRKPFINGSTYREGRVYCRPWNTEIKVMLYEEETTVEYAEKCAEAMNNMPEALIDAICRAARLFCTEFCDEISDDWREELNLTVPVDENTPPEEMMKCFRPTVLIVEPPKDPSRTGYQLECTCDWEEEHGMEIDILDDRLVFLSEFTGDSPWADHTGQSWNYADRIRQYTAKEEQI